MSGWLTSFNPLSTITPNSVFRTQSEETNLPDKRRPKDKGSHGGRTFLGFIGSGISPEVHSPEVLTSAALPAAITDFADKLMGTTVELNLSLIEEPGKGWM